MTTNDPIIVIDEDDDNDDKFTSPEEKTLKRKRVVTLDESERARELKKIKLALNRLKREEARLSKKAEIPMVLDGGRSATGVGMDPAAKTFAVLLFSMIGFQPDQTMDYAEGDYVPDEHLVPLVNPVCLDDWGVYNFLHSARNDEAEYESLKHKDEEGNLRKASSLERLLVPDERTSSDGTSGMVDTVTPKKKWRNTNRTHKSMLLVKEKFLRKRFIDTILTWDYLWKPYLTPMGTMEWPAIAIETQPAYEIEKIAKKFKFTVHYEDRRRALSEPGKWPEQSRVVVWRASKGIARGEYTYTQRKKLAPYIAEALCVKMGIPGYFSSLAKKLEAQGLDTSKIDDIADAFLLAVKMAMFIMKSYIDYDGIMFYKGRRPVGPTARRYRCVSFDTMIAQIDIPDWIFERRKPVRKSDGR